MSLSVILKNLRNRKISDKEYEYNLIFPKKNEMKTMKDYHDLYLEYTVLLLADVFKKFRNNSLKKCGFCPSRYLGAPGFSWYAILKKKKVKLKFQILA